MRPYRTPSRTNPQAGLRRDKRVGLRGYKNDEQGIIIVLVAVVMLFVVGAMAALSIDVVTLYTARSEAQLAADAAALAAVRVLANSGATSDTTGASMANAWTIAQVVAHAVAKQNTVGGVTLKDSNLTFPANPGGTNSNPTVTIRVQVGTLPTFFSRIWGNTSLKVAASATAEAYNPSGGSGTVGVATLPVAPLCVKPWLLPNMDPSAPGPIFNPDGSIATTTLLGPPGNSIVTGKRLSFRCGPTGDCTSGALPFPAAAAYYPGDDATTFPHPTNSLPTCSQASMSSPTSYQKSIAGCIQTPISCNNSAYVDFTAYGPTRNSDTADAVNCLTHAPTGSSGDADQGPSTASPPFQFLAGNNNPVVTARGKTVMVSDSLATVPVFNSTVGVAPTSPVTIIGFVQLFLNPDGVAASEATGLVDYTVINLAGCGTGATGTAIVGNGASPVAVRLISQ